jgi:uncharacterized protein
MIVQYNVQMAMRDGTWLSADIYRPAGTNPCAAVLIRTCYTKAQGRHAQRAPDWVKAGYVYVVQDVRGRGDSDGSFYPFVHETEDGSDTIDWIASQPWSDGRVVMVGESYMGLTQLYVACSLNPRLKALIPVAAPADPDRGFPMSFGMIMTAAGTWMATLDGHACQDLTGVDLGTALTRHPVYELDKTLGRELIPWRDWIEHAVRDEYWERQAYQSRLLRSGQPMLHISGWYDDCLSGSLENFAALSARDSRAIRQRLCVGPWAHGAIGKRCIGDIDFGQAAEINIDELQRAWFDSCLEGTELDLPPVKLFVMGRNAWIDAQEWPIKETKYIPYYLHSNGKANTRRGDGTLAVEVPGVQLPDRFRYDPLDPVPYSDSLDWRQVGGPDNCLDIELREDVLVYTTPPMQDKLMVCGPIKVRLYAASNALDTDWTAKLVLVTENGRAIRLNDGALRARFRLGHDREVFVSPGEAQEYLIDCWATCIELKVGDQLRLEVSSSAFGKFDLNLNGGGPVGREAEPVVAEQTVYHDAAHPSCVIVPVLPSNRCLQ